MTGMGLMPRHRLTTTTMIEVLKRSFRYHAWVHWLVVPVDAAYLPPAGQTPRRRETDSLAAVVTTALACAKLVELVERAILHLHLHHQLRWQQGRTRIIAPWDLMKTRTRMAIIHRWR